MKNDERYDVWTSFLEEYNEYFISIDDVWDINFDKLKEFIDINKKTPSLSKNNDEKFIALWLKTQKRDYKNRTYGMSNNERYDVWTNFLEEYNEYFISIDDVWDINFDKLKEFIDGSKKTPSSKSKNGGEKILGRWLVQQNKNYKNRSGGMKNNERYDEWTHFVNEYLTKKETVKQKSMKSMKLVKPIQTKTEETPENKRIRTKSEMEILHKRYKTLTSSNLNKEFKENTQLWNEYHEISEKNEESFPENEIPRNKIIQELDKLVIKRKRTVVDMGCGKGQISKYFTDKNDKRFQFINYDHVSNDESVISCDISNVPLEDGSVDIVILSLAMWGSNCKSYIAEANRILDLDGKLYIIEATKRWSEKDENHNLIQGEEGGKLKQLLLDNNFQILESEIKKFSMFTCMKIN
jgi:ribosomal RNA-processing protein 8